MAAGKPTSQDGIDRAGSPVKLLWAQGPPPRLPGNIEPEYVGWKKEQAAPFGQHARKAYRRHEL